MNSTIAKLADEFEKMEKTIASQKKMIETLMPTGYVDTDTVKLHLNSVYGVMFGGRPLSEALQAGRLFLGRDQYVFLLRPCRQGVRGR